MKKIFIYYLILLPPLLSLKAQSEVLSTEMGTSVGNGSDSYSTG
ncbi:Uncharacterised protein [Chryseobacterium nakagawai]|nr:Uncharacterised protein [Chryseobacterium nakagawai]